MSRNQHHVEACGRNESKAGAYKHARYHQRIGQPVASSLLSLDLECRQLVVNSNVRSTMKIP